MPFEVTVNTEMREGAKILIPLSIGKKECTGERLKALINFAKKYNTVLLLADTLQKHNTGNESIALGMGDKFIESNHEALKGAIQIQTLEGWNKYKDTSELKLVRWAMWAKIKESELPLANLTIEGEVKRESSGLLQSMKDEAKTNRSSKSEESSINYQKEEDAYMLTFSDFEYHLYHNLNMSQQKIYELFLHKFKIPQHVSPNFINKNSEIGLFAEKKNKNNLPFAMRLLIENAQKILSSSEFSDESKQLCAEKLSSLLPMLLIEQSKMDTNKKSITPTDP